MTMTARRLPLPIAVASAVSIAFALGAPGCADTGAQAGCPTALIYAPAESRMPDAWPDDFWTRPDERSQTGVRLHLVSGENLTIPPEAERFRRVFSDLNQLDGFGVNASPYLRFTGPLDPASLKDGLVLVDLDAPRPTPVPFEVQLVKEDEELPGAMVLLQPLTPLRERAHYGIALTTAVRDAQGACVAASQPMRQLLATSQRHQSFADRLAGAGLLPEGAEVSAALLFSTQHTVSDSAAVARDIAARAQQITYQPGPTCTDAGKFRVCEGKMRASDYRTKEGFIDETNLVPQAAYDIPVIAYLPRGRTPPFPTLLYGHGLNGDRKQAERLAEIAAPKGYATIAIDALRHGQHPDGPKTIAAIDFFGISLQGQDLIDTRRLRDNFRQSAYDKLQLVQLLRRGLDLDRDGAVDVNAQRLTYLGVSLGGIMSAEFLAFAPEVRVAMPIVPGARVVDIVKDGETFAPAIQLLQGQSTRGELLRFFTLLQTAIDRGDAGTYAPHVARERLPGFDAQVPQVLMQMVIDDETVPNTTNRYFARALGAPHVGDALQAIGGVPRQQAMPVRANMGPRHTAGIFQYDLVYDGAGPKTRKATHGNVAANPVAVEQTLRFIESSLLEGVGEIIDPYRTLGIKN
jgi:dienelactone hydrolase